MSALLSLVVKFVAYHNLRSDCPKAHQEFWNFYFKCIESKLNLMTTTVFLLIVVLLKAPCWYSHMCNCPQNLAICRYCPSAARHLGSKSQITAQAELYTGIWDWKSAEVHTSKINTEKHREWCEWLSPTQLIMRVPEMKDMCKTSKHLANEDSNLDLELVRRVEWWGLPLPAHGAVCSLRYSTGCTKYHSPPHTDF